MDLAISLDPASEAPLHRQLYDELRRAVLLGRIAPGTRLPSTRALAHALDVSRATVMLSFDQLIGEGYLQARTGSGTFVSRHLPDELLRAVRTPTLEGGSPKAPALSKFAISLRGAAQLEASVPSASINFRDGRPAFDQFPITIWRKLLAAHCQATVAMLDYTADPAGYLPLREAIAAYIARARAVRCTARNVVVVGGSQQALDLATRVLVDRGDCVAIEDPGYPGACKNFLAQGAEVLPIPVDAHGMIVQRLFETTGTVKLVYVTPSHQYPKGAAMPLHRRLELLRWAHRTGTIVLEDDYDSAYRYGARPIPALQGLDESESVIYVGTFSKVLFPALRIGYLVVPDSLTDVFVRAKAYSDRQSPLLEQHALADFIEEGHFERHLRRMHHLYGRRRAALVRALQHHFGEAVTIVGENAGMHLLARFETERPNADIAHDAAQAGVFVTSAEPLYLRGGGRGEFVFGFAELDEPRIDEGISRLAQVMH
jgi:GntR family transcriptional regulator/MocR family aminotransferase